MYIAHLKRAALKACVLVCILSIIPSTAFANLGGGPTGGSGWGGGEGPNGGGGSSKGGGSSTGGSSSSGGGSKGGSSSSGGGSKGGGGGSSSSGGSSSGGSSSGGGSKGGDSGSSGGGREGYGGSGRAGGVGSPGVGGGFSGGSSGSGSKGGTSGSSGGSSGSGNTGNNPGNPNAAGYNGGTSARDTTADSINDAVGRGSYAPGGEVSKALGNLSDTSNIGRSALGGGLGTPANNPSNPNAPGYFGGTNVEKSISVTNDPGVLGNLMNRDTLANVPGLSFMGFGINKNAPVSIAGYVGVQPTTVQTTRVNPNDVPTKNIGTAPAPTGPTNSFTGSVNPNDATISLKDVVSFTGDSLRDPSVVSYDGQTANVTPATPAHIGVMGFYKDRFSQNDIATLGKAIAGEVRSDLVSKIANGTALTSRELQEVSVTVNTALNRAFATRAVAYGPFNGSLADAITAPQQYSAFNPGAINTTNTNYGLNPTAFDSLAKGFVDGSLTEEHGLGVTAAAGTATHYSNEAEADVSWQGALTDRETFGPAGQAHTAGKLGSEYSSQGQVTGVDDVAVAAYNSVMNAANTTTTVAPSLGRTENGTSISPTGGTAVGATVGGTAFNGVDPDDFADSFTADRPATTDTLGGLAVSPNTTAPTVDIPAVSLMNPTYTDLNIPVQSAIDPVTGLATNIDPQSQVDVEGMTDNAKSMLNDMASKLSFDLSLSSGYRNAAYNAKVDGVPNSQHIAGTAADISTRGLTPEQKAELGQAIASTPAVGGWGFYDNRVHVDIGTKRSWGPTGRSASIDRGLASQPEMADSYREWAAGRSVPSPATGGSVVGVTDRDLDSLGEIDRAYNETRENENTNTPSTGSGNTPSTGTGNTPSTPNTTNNDRGVFGRISDNLGRTWGRIGDTFGGLFDRSPSRNEGRNDDRPGSGSATSTSLLNTGNQSAAIAFAQEEDATSDTESLSFMQRVGESIAHALSRLFGTGEPVENFSDLSSATALAEAKPYLPVIVTIDGVTGAVSFDQGLLQGVSEDEALAFRDAMEEARGEIMDEVGDVPSLLIEDGKIIYSDGSYAPEYVDGVPLGESKMDYVYTIMRVDENGFATADVNNESIPGSALTNVVGDLFLQDNSWFSLADIADVTYVLVDPDPALENNEYKEYTVLLKDGSTREISLPIISSLDYYTQELRRIGYRDDAFQLLLRGVETDRIVLTPEPDEANIVEKALSSISEFFKRLNGTDEERFADLQSLTPLNSDRFTTDDITGLTVYIGVPVECPGAGLINSYVYKATFRGVNANNDPEEGYVAFPRCGDGGPRTYVTAIAEHLESTGRFADLDVERLLDMAEFEYSGLASGFLLAQEDEEEVIPNTTNEVTFEAKVLSSTGVVVRDWSNSNVTVKSGEQLHLRWNAPAYTRCLPFIGDNGAYSLMHGGDLRMTTGNTETVGYKLVAQTGTYRVECDGQSNGEEGVDTRSIQLTVTQ